MVSTSTAGRKSSNRTIPAIACFNHADTPLGVDFDVLVAAMQVYVDQFVAPAWGTPAELIKATNFVKGAWAMPFVDSSREAALEGYHDLTPEGLPMSMVFVTNSLKNKELVSVSASHQLVEMLVDPGINLVTTGPGSGLYAYESADPVEALSFNVDGIPMSDFVYPAYFEYFHRSGSVQFDQMNRVTRPFEILEGGYQIVFKKGKWSYLTVSATKAKALAHEDREGHRSQKRGRSGKLTKADRKEIARRGRGL
jgi:hypothetical protein